MMLIVGQNIYRLAEASTHQVVDFRDPDYVPSEYWQEKHATHEAIVEIGDTKIFLYNYAEGNTLEWSDMLDAMRTDFSDLPSGDVPPAHLLTKKGNLVLDNGHEWGNASQFSITIQPVVKPLLEASIIKPTTKVFVGNWASGRGKLVGKARDFLREKVKIPMKMVMYHGTSNVFLDDILERGLTAQPVAQRAWKQETQKDRPKYRETAVYMTLDKFQASYYATKATNVLRRNGYTGVKPVILRITVPKRAYKNFRPDDDYLVRLKERGDATWLDSLGEVSQIAYEGSIPPEWIEVESQGVGKHEYEEPMVASTKRKAR